MTIFNKLQNRLQGITSYLRREIRVTHQPITLEIEVTNRCFEDCWMCPRRYMQRATGDLTLDLLKDILCQVRDTVELVNLFHAGEPLLHPKLGEMIAYCKSQGVQTLVTTTGALLTEKRGRELIDSGLDMLVLSLDAASPETYAQVRKHSHYERVVENIIQFLELKQRLGRGPHVQAQMVLMDLNRQEAISFVNLWRNRADSVRAKRFYNTANIGRKIHQSIPERKLNQPLPCIMLWREPVICWDGQVLPCCVDLIGRSVVGDIRRESLRSIWNGPALVEMRRLHVAGRYREIDVCKDCTIFQVRWPFVVGSMLFDDLTIRKISPIIERMDTLSGHRQASYF